MVSTPWQDPGLLTSLRVCPAAETLKRVMPLARAAGITRLAPLTDLDALRLPVYTAIRPLAKSLSTSQGKGMSITDAKCSAIMESLEAYHAEEIAPNITATPLEELSGIGYIPVSADIEYPSGYPHDWVQGETDSGEKMWVLHAAISMDTQRSSVVRYGNSTNGLASGNTVAEARLHGLLEVIERAARKNPPQSVVDLPDHPLLLALTEQHQVAIDVYPNVYGLPVFGCRLQSRSLFDNQVYFLGFGCHLDKAIALQRALTEAVQSKVTTIAGSRDDIGVKDYLHTTRQRSLPLHERRIAYADIASAAANTMDSVESALRETRLRLRRAQHQSLHVVVFNEAYAVVKVFIDAR